MRLEGPRVDLLREGLDAGVAAQRPVEGRFGAVLHPAQSAGGTLLVVLVIPVGQKAGQVGRGEGLEGAVVEGFDGVHVGVRHLAGAVHRHPDEVRIAYAGHIEVLGGGDDIIALAVALADLGFVSAPGLHPAIVEPEGHIDALDLLDVVSVLEGFGEEGLALIILLQVLDGRLPVHLEGDDVLRLELAGKLSAQHGGVAAVEVLTNAVTNVANVMENGYDGAEILGIHFEGPYLDMKYKGAQPDQYIVKPTIEQFEHYQKAARGHIRYVTLATEHDEDFALTRYLTAHGVVVSIGHSGATYEQAVMAYANGARSMTHVYNGMSPFNHRANGLVGAAYRIRTMYGEIICDGCHSTPAALNNYFMSKGPDYAIMISDALMAKGTPIGSEYIFGGNHITIYPDGSAHLDNGTLAGSTLNINKGLRILVEEAMVPFNYALNACTINPARCLHLDDRKGSIQIGKDADLVVLDDNYDVLQTYCMGKAQL